MRWMSLWAIVLFPAAALAEPTPITSLAQVQQLCKALQPPAAAPGEGAAGDAMAEARSEIEQKAARKAALRQEYVLDLSPGQFKIAEADADSGTVTIDTQRAFRFFKGQVVFYPVDDEDLDLTVADGQSLPSSSADLTLRLVVRPGQDADKPCYQGLTKDDVIGVEILSAHLLDRQGKVVASAEEDGGIERQAKATGAPEVSVEPAMAEGPGDYAKRITEGVVGLKPELMACYTQGLGRAPALDGSMVVGFDVSREGRPAGVAVIADSVQDPDMAQCVAKAFAKLSLPKKGGRASVAVRFERK